MIYDASYRKLERVMIDPRKPSKNMGEVCSLAYVKAKGISVFATDEMNLQPIIDSQLNIGFNDSVCIRIVDLIQKAYTGEFDISRNICKALWIVVGKKKETFDKELWPVVEKQY